MNLTKQTCIEYQNEAREAYYAAQWLTEHGFTIISKTVQRKAAAYADEAMMRLFQLIGTW